MSIEQIKKRIPLLTFLISYKCTNECKHCALQGSPNQDEISMELGDVKRYLEDVTANYIVDEVGFFGGEPLLNLDLLISLIEEVKRYDIPNIGLPTNGYWGKNDLIAKKYVLKLKEAGINTIGFSVDTFHQEFVPLDVVKRAMKAAHEVGIERIYSITQNLGPENINNFFNDQNKKITEVISKEFEFCQVINSELQVRGRAAKQLTEYYSMNTIPSDKCLIFKVPMFMIDPNGWVFHQLCHGICIGNAKENSLSDIIKEFNYRKHPIIGKVVAKGGPQNLLEIAIEKGYKPQNGYADKCHLCFCAQNFLRPFYPNILEPSNLFY
ncbi:MAG: radical SAM protein [Candidatus Lokiarchaeota archaeon]|nr:radical SAM protein [Candidatus Lokiarchaeota archaeon]